MTTWYLELARACGGPVLELACGTGRITNPLAAEGIDITGLDLSADMLARAREKAKAAGLRVEYMDADMRRFHLDRLFSLIFIPFNSVLHLTTSEDLRSCFAAARAHLAPDGRFALDMFNPDVRKLARAPGVRMTESVVTDSLGELTIETSVDYDHASQINRSTRYVSAPDHPDLLVVPLHLRCIFPQELPLLLELSGLRLESRFGDFERTPFVNESPLQVCVAQSL
jgi:SAM-dependent methyltransferase